MNTHINIFPQGKSLYSFLLVASFSLLSTRVYAQCDIKITDHFPVNNIFAMKGIPRVGDSLYGYRANYTVTGTPKGPVTVRFRMAGQVAEFKNITLSSSGYVWCLLKGGVDGDVPVTVEIDPEQISGDTNYVDNNVSTSFRPLAPEGSFEAFGFTDVDITHTYGRIYTADSYMTSVRFYNLIPPASSTQSNVRNVNFDTNTINGISSASLVDLNFAGSLAGKLTTPAYRKEYYWDGVRTANTIESNRLSFRTTTNKTRVNATLLEKITWAEVEQRDGSQLVDDYEDRMVPRGTPWILNFVQRHIPIKANVSPWRAVHSIVKGLTKELAYATDNKYWITLSHLASGIAHDEDFSRAFNAAARELGFKARLVTGFWTPSQTSSRVWSEVFMPGVGWLPVDVEASEFYCPTGEFAYYVGTNPDGNGLNAVAIAPSSGYYSTADGTDDVSLYISTWGQIDFSSYTVAPSYAPFLRQISVGAQPLQMVAEDTLYAGAESSAGTFWTSYWAELVSGNPVMAQQSVDFELDNASVYVATPLQMNGNNLRFSILVSDNAPDSTVRIIARTTGASAAKTFNVRAKRRISLSADVGGLVNDTARFTFTLSSPANATGSAIAKISTDAPWLQVPATVKVATGETSVSFIGSVTNYVGGTANVIAECYGQKVTCSVTFLPDVTPPTSRITYDPAAVWTNSDVMTTIQAVDAYTGTGGITSFVREIRVSQDNYPEVIIPGSSISARVSGNGIHSIAYYAVDHAGNIEATKYGTVRIDKTRPTVDGYSVGSLVTVIAQDTVSGVAAIKVSVDGAAAVDYTGSFVVPAGAHTVTYWAVDQAGNESTRETILVGVSVGSVTVAPTTLYSTKAGVGTVRLSLAAPAGGVTVYLDSNSPAVSVPSTVTVPAGAITATFPVTASSVSTDTKAVITASVGGQEAYGTVYVLVPFPKTLTVAPTTIVGGDTAIATVSLASNAGVGGQVVNLSSSNINVAVPATVTVPAGALTATFPVQTSIVNSDMAAAISAEADGTGITTTVLIKRVAPKSITFAPASVIGGNTSVATVTVTKPAPAGGIVVDLRSASATVTVPTTVTIPEGATTATFQVTTVPVRKTESAMIQASAAGVKVSANITVTAISVVSVGLNPATVVGGLNSTATLTLNGVAPVGGTTIQLYAGNAAATVPVSVVVPGGSKTVTFPVTTVPVAANTAVVIAAKYLGVTKSATLTVAAPTVSTVTLAPTSVVGGGTSTLKVKLTGKAASAGVIVTLTASNAVVAQLPASVTIPAGSDTVDVTVQTTAVAAVTNVTLTAKTGTVSKTAVLTVTK